MSGGILETVCPCGAKLKFKVSLSVMSNGTEKEKHSCKACKSIFLIGLKKNGDQVSVDIGVQELTEMARLKLLIGH